MPYGYSAHSGRSRLARQRWFDRITDSLSSFPREWPMGIITHMQIEAEAKEVIRTAGFHDVSSLHYGDERGSNLLEDVRVLVVLGLPIPNVEDFKEEAQAFLYAGQHLDFTWEVREQFLDMRDGQHPVNVGGYWTEPVASYYRQKCQSGLYQAVHRIRPYLVEPDDERHIFIFTNMPVRDVKVEELLRDPEVVRLENRFEDVVKQIEALLAVSGTCTVPDLARLVASNGEQSSDSIRHWISDNGAKLAEDAGATFEPGIRGRAGRFGRPGTNI